MQSPEPEAHDKVLDNSPDRIGIWKCCFLRRGENRSTAEKPPSKDEKQQQTQPTYDAESGNRTRATLVGGECSTTAPTLLPKTKTGSTLASLPLKSQVTKHTTVNGLFPVQHKTFHRYSTPTSTPPPPPPSHEPSLDVQATTCTATPR